MANSRSRILLQADSISSAFHELAAQAREFDDGYKNDELRAFTLTQAFEHFVTLIQGEMTQQAYVNDSYGGTD